MTLSLNNFIFEFNIYFLALGNNVAELLEGSSLTASMYTCTTIKPSSMDYTVVLQQLY